MTFRARYFLIGLVALIAAAAFENARRPVQQLLLPVVDPVRMNAELTRQLGDRPVPPTAATTTPSL